MGIYFHNFQVSHASNFLADKGLDVLNNLRNITTVLNSDLQISSHLFRANFNVNTFSHIVTINNFVFEVCQEATTYGEQSRYSLKRLADDGFNHFVAVSNLATEASGYMLLCQIFSCLVCHNSFLRNVF